MKPMCKGLLLWRSLNSSDCKLLGNNLSSQEVFNSSGQRCRALHAFVLLHRFDRETATNVAFLAPDIAVIASQLLAILIVEGSNVGVEMATLLFVQFIIAAIGFVVAVFVVSEKPFRAPSRSAKERAERLHLPVCTLMECGGDIQDASLSALCRGRVVLVKPVSCT